MVYYLVLMATSVCFVLPFFTAMTMSKPAADQSLIATVALNLTGLMVFFLRLSLRFKRSCYTSSDMPTSPHARSKSITTLFHRRHSAASDKTLSFGHHITSPVIAPPLPTPATQPKSNRPASIFPWPTRQDSLATRCKTPRRPAFCTSASAPEIVITRTPSSAKALELAGHHRNDSKYCPLSAPIIPCCPARTQGTPSDLRSHPNIPATSSNACLPYGRANEPQARREQHHQRPRCRSDYA